MHYLAIGDIHGCHAALTMLAEAAPFSQAETLVFLGDYVDRGPQSRQVIDWLVHQQHRREIVVLRGNHDVMMLQARRGDLEFYDWLHFGGDATLQSYGVDGRPGRLENVPPEHWQFLEATLPIYVAEADFFVHAGVDPARPLDDQPQDVLYWQKLDESQPPHASGKRMICGHTAQRNGLPLDFGHVVCLDTWVYGEGWLTALDVESGAYWQANEKGQTRTGTLG